MTRNQKRRIGKQVVHLLERQILRLGQEEVEEERVGEVADDEEVVAAVNLRVSNA
jgi:hypothetical protein